MKSVVVFAMSVVFGLILGYQAFIFKNKQPSEASYEQKQMESFTQMGKTVGGTATLKIPESSSASQAVGSDISKAASNTEKSSLDMTQVVGDTVKVKE